MNKEGKLDIALDFDNCVCDSYQVWTNILHNTFPEKRPHVALPDQNSWDLNEVWGCNDAEKEVIFNIFRHKALKYASPMDTNWYVWVKMLIEEGHNVFILTSNPNWMIGTIQYWLKEFGLKLPVVFTDTIAEKRHHKFDVLVDDSPQAYNMVDWEKDGRVLFIYHQPYNQNLLLNNNIHRVYNFQGVYKHIKQLENN